MSPFDSTTILRRIDELLALEVRSSQAQAQQAYQGALTLHRAVRGPGSEQAAELVKTYERVCNSKGTMRGLVLTELAPAVQGSLRALKADIEAGLTGDIERLTVGEVVADMLGLAKEALADGRDGTTNVAAVLAAAAYEDTVRRMGSSLANVKGRPKLADVVTALKDAQILVGGPHRTAQNYLSFRNDAMHADWDKIDRATVSSCVAFVEGLVLQHLS